LAINRFLSLVDIGVGAGAATVMASAWVTAVALESATLAEKLKVPAAVGVPVREPAEVKPIPAGRVPLKLHVYGGTPPDADKVWLYAAPTVPLARVVVEMATGGTATAATEMESALVTEAAVEAESVTLAVKL
jgi:hypothetical protein